MNKLEKKERFIRLRALGVPYSEIEKELGITKKTLIEWERKLREDIRKERAVEIEHIRSVYWAEKRERIDFLGNVRNACTRRNERVTFQKSSRRR